MQSHETELLLNPESHQQPTRQKDESGAASGAEALLNGRTDALTPSAVMHLQKTAGNEAVTSAIEEQEPSLVHGVVGSGGGSPLDRETRGFMETRLGADFGDVRVHTDSKASESAKSVQAHAYTVGSDIVFQSGKYDPGSDSGKRMLAHELTHVVQQRSGPVDGTPADGGIKISNPADRFEQAAEQSANDVMASNQAAPALEGAGPSLQREPDSGDDKLQDEKDGSVQGFFVQREDDEIPDDEKQ